MKATVASLAEGQAGLQTAVDGLGEAQATTGDKVGELANEIRSNKADQESTNQTVIQMLASIQQSIAAKTS